VRGDPACDAEVEGLLHPLAYRMAVLDGRAGLERFYAVCSPAPLRYEDLTKSVRAAVRRAEDVRKGPGLPGLPKGARQVSLLVEKRP